ncbi:MAG TPA: Crp/Fnr family transcriptional regulator [Anaerolineales bacterium]|nr:Crp/Fnr family transcriptional regulator [Anaerolineales bacterium]
MSLYSALPSSTEAARTLLRQIELFGSLTEDELDRAAGQLRSRTFGPGVTLFHQGMPGSSLYVIESGSVRVFAVGLTGQEHTFTTFGPGNFFGELSVIDGLPRTASAITLDHSVIWLMLREGFNKLLDESPSFCREVVQVLARRIRRSATHVESIIFQDVLGRVAYEVLNLADRHGRETSGGIEIDMPLTQSDLASIVGATRESVNKALAALRKQGLLETEGTRLQVLNAEKLMELVGRRGR